MLGERVLERGSRVFRGVGTKRMFGEGGGDSQHISQPASSAGYSENIRKSNE